MTSSDTGLDRVRKVLDRLLDPENGCPWDLKQTPDTIRLYILEETYELIEAIEAGRPEDVREEMGDCLFLLFFLARLYRSRGLFELGDVLSDAADKMIARHPHIFADADQAESAEEVRVRWHELKRKEKPTGLLDSVPASLPALVRANRLTERAGRIGFDWDGPAAVLETVEEELGELKSALAAGDNEAVRAELGDVLFTLANLARHLKVNPEDSLRAANDRFLKRFGYIEKSLLEEGKSLEEAGLAEMDRLWAEAKAREI